MSDEAVLGRLRSYCVGGTKYAVGIPNILRIISMGVPDILYRIYSAGVPKTGEAKYPATPVHVTVIIYDTAKTIRRSRFHVCVRGIVLSRVRWSPVIIGPPGPSIAEIYGLPSSYSVPPACGPSQLAISMDITSSP